jgi:hypothetical protein
MGVVQRLKTRSTTGAIGHGSCVTPAAALRRARPGALVDGAADGALDGALDGEAAAVADAAAVAVAARAGTGPSGVVTIF